MLSIESRIAIGAKILEQMAEIREDWELMREAARERGDLALKVSLIHPDWYQSEVIIGRDPRGSRFFSTNPPGGQTCQSAAIWGYTCQLYDHDLVADHLFPYSAGGATDSRNLVWLCRWHNSIKSSDIHLVDWDSVDCTWVDDLLDRITIRRETLRLSSG